MRIAETCNYWKTSTKAADTWIDEAAALIVKAGGTILAQAFGQDATDGTAAYVLQFRLADDDGHEETFKVIWPVLTSRGGEHVAARRQAATMLYHDIKAKCVSAQVLGFRAAFFTWLALPDGRPVSHLADAELAEQLPGVLRIEGPT